MITLILQVQGSVVIQSCLTLCGPMDCSLQATWNSPGENTGVGLPNLGTEPESPALQADSLPSEPSGKPVQVRERVTEQVSKPCPSWGWRAGPWSRLLTLTPACPLPFSHRAAALGARSFGVPYLLGVPFVTAPEEILELWPFFFF